MPRYTIVHEQYLIEWLMKNYPPGTWRTNVRLGTVAKELRERALEPGELKALSLWLFQADAIIILPEKVIIIEAVVRPEWHKLIHLEEYAKAFKATMEFEEHWHKPIELVILTTIDSPFHRALAAEKGIRMVLYQPDWIIPYLQRYGIRKRRPAGAYVEV